jgi:hypothetical protein
MWRQYLKLAQGYSPAHPDGIISYTAHKLGTYASVAVNDDRYSVGYSPSGWPHGPTAEKVVSRRVNLYVPRSAAFAVPA